MAYQDEPSQKKKDWKDIQMQWQLKNIFAKDLQNM